MSDPEPFSSIEDSRALAQAIVDTIREPLLVLDKDLRVVAASRSFYLTFEMQRQDVQGLPIYALGHGQWDIPGLRLLLDRILPQHTVMDDYEVELVFSTIGRRNMVLNARTVFYEGSGQALILLSIEDITQRRMHERGLAELLAQKETLLQEMQHRVANSLQIIASILLLKARTVQSDETRLHLHDAHRRVMSVAAVQQHLQATGHGEQFPIAPYLSRLCETLAASMIGEDRHIRMEVRAGAADVSSTEAVSIGLIVTELVINALKHAFGQPSAIGAIVVSYEVAKAGWRLTVSDDGVGVPANGGQKATPGLGTSIVEALAKQLDGHVEISRTVPHGMTVSITHGAFPMRLPDAAWMALGFPNESRHYDEATHMVRFWGHDGAMEASFFVGEEALTKLQPGMPTDEAGLLGAFDAHRALIYKTAAKVYGRGRKGAYDILPADF